MQETTQGHKKTQNPMRPYTVVRIVVLGAISASLAIVSASAGANSYEIVRGRELAVCRALAANLNTFAGEPPMVCERKLHPGSKALSLPDWQPLEGEAALKAALALVKAQAEKGPREEASSRYATMKAKVESEWSSGQLKAWEARFDLAKSGEQVRVVLVRSGECRRERNSSSGDPVVGVLLPDKWEVDTRYRLLSHVDGDVVVHQGTAYIVTWQQTPAATYSDPKGPPRLHRGYILARPPYWLPSGQADGPKAGLLNPVCQIGFRRLNQAREGEKQ